MRGVVGDAIAVSNPRAVWLITIAHGVNEFYSLALPPVLPLIVADFGLSYGQAGALLTVYYVMYSLFQLPAGVLADRVGKRSLLAVGMMGLAGGLLLASAAGDFLTLLAAQVVAGIAGSTYHPTGMSIIADLETGHTEGRAMGVHGFGGVAGTALAPALIGGVAAVFDWRVALAAGAWVGLVYGVVFALRFTEPGSSGDIEEASVGPSSDPPVTNSLLDRSPIPLAPWVAGLFAANLLVSFTTGAARTFTTSYVFERMAGSTTLANGVFFVMLVGAGVASIGAGRLADRMDRTVLGSAGFVVSAGLLAAMPLVPATPFVLIGWFLVLGGTMWTTLPAINALVSSHSERSFSGSLFGVMLSAAAIGSGGGPFVVGIVAERIGIELAFPLIGVVCLLGAVAFVVLRQL